MVHPACYMKFHQIKKFQLNGAYRLTCSERMQIVSWMVRGKAQQDHSHLTQLLLLGMVGEETPTFWGVQQPFQQDHGPKPPKRQKKQ